MTRTMMPLVEVVDEDDETKTGHHQNEVWGEEGQTGPIQKRKGPSKIIYRNNLSFNLFSKDHCFRTCPFSTSYLVIRVKSADTRKIESAAARAISSWNKQNL